MKYAKRMDNKFTSYSYVYFTSSQISMRLDDTRIFNTHYTMLFKLPCLFEVIDVILLY